MTSTATPAEIAAKVRTRGHGNGSRRGRRVKPKAPRKRPSSIWLFVGLGVLALLIAAGAWMWWLASGLLDASRIVQDKAGVAQSELQMFRDTLKAGDEDAAKTHLQAGEAALADARRAAAADQVRTAKGLPYVGNTVNDLDHLLAAAGIMTDSARDALGVYENFSGEDSKLFHNGKFSIPAIHDAQASVAAIKESMSRAAAELHQVHGKGPKGDEALAKKRSALKQIASLREEIVSLGPLLEAMPSAVGAGGRKTYLVAIMNPSEMRASGGAPLSVAFVRFKDGKMSIPLKGSTSELTHIDGQLNAQLYWKRLTGQEDPFARAAGLPERFVNTNFNPDFATSGRQMMRATKANFGYETDGVIALDIKAIAHLLDLTGPIKTQFYGTLTAKNIAHKLVVKAYTSGIDPEVIAKRHSVNDTLMAVMLTRLTEGGGLIGKARAIGAAIPGRHLQMYFRDNRLQDIVVDKDMGGTIPVRKTGNLSAVYTQNGNGSKMDVFQQRTVRERVRLRADGSAVVRRSVHIANPTPRYLGALPDPRKGYETRWATELIINLMPKGAKITEQPSVILTGTVGSGVDQNGHAYAKAAVVLPPDGQATVSWEYVVPHAGVVKGDRMYFRDYVAPQPMLHSPTLDLTVVAPKGWSATPAGGSATSEGWKHTPLGAKITVPMNQLQVLKLLLRK